MHMHMYVHTDTNRQAADILTKGFTNPEKWLAVRTLIYHVDPEGFWKAPKDEDSVPILPVVQRISPGSTPMNLGLSGSVHVLRQ